MLSLIENNPYRVLGLFGDASDETIQERIAQIDSGHLQFELDLVFFGQPLPERTPNSARVAADLIANDKTKKYRRFWFVSDNNRSAIDALLCGNLDTAIASWAAKLSVFGGHNLSIACLAKGEIGKAAVYLCSTYYWSDIYSKRIGINASPAEFASMFLSDLYSDGMAATSVYMSNTDSADWKSYVDASIIDYCVSVGKPYIYSAGNNIQKDYPDTYFEAMKAISSNCEDYLYCLSILYGKDNPSYIKFADLFSRQFLTYIHHYVTESTNVSRYEKSEMFIDGAMLYCPNPAFFQFANQKLLDIKDVKSNGVNPSVCDLCGRIEFHVLRYILNTHDDPDEARNLIYQCAPFLSKLRGQLGDVHPTYVRISLLLAETVLKTVGNVLGQELTEQLVADSSSVIALVDEFWWHQNMPREIYYIRNEYMDKLMELSGENKRFPNVLSKLSINRDVLYPENIFYRYHCDTLNGCKRYITLFPDGEHLTDIQERILRLEPAQQVSKETVVEATHSSENNVLPMLRIVSVVMLVGAIIGAWLNINAMGIYFLIFCVAVPFSLLFIKGKSTLRVLIPSMIIFAILCIVCLIIA